MLCKSWLGVAMFLLAMPVLGDWLEIRPSNHPVTVNATGVVTSKNTTRINPPPSFFWNLTIGALVQEGQRVKPGDLLVRFESTQEDARHRRASEELQVSRGELTSTLERHQQELETENLKLAEAKSRAEKARRKASQPVDLIPSVEYQKLAKELELADKLVELLTNRAELSHKVRTTNERRIRLAVKRHEKKQAAARSDVDKFNVKATREGIAVIGSHWSGEKYDVGSMTQPSDVVVEIVDESDIEITGIVREKYAARLRLDQPVRMVVDSSGGLKLTGRISELGNSVKRRSRFSQEMVREFKVELDSLPELLKIGTSVQTTIEVQRLDNAIAVPINSIQYREGLPGVLTRIGWRNVTLGEPSDDRVIVIEGLSEGDSISI